PFNSQLNLTYNIIRPGDVRLSIYDQAGRMVTSLTQVWQNAGQSQVIWDAGGMSSGNYLIKAVIGDRVEYRKVTLVR
ncbi:MAG: T9SS type A sorting domain-containing protein, partial [Calditrichaeota bacterium]|nr:T9SS type A sorting domain-containing protein [Calditrichota bacterium]